MTIKHKTELLTIFIFSVAILITSCTSDDELKKSIYIPDKNYPQLPQYSELGYNTFGAFYDREVFTSISTTIPVKVINKDGNTTFVFAGRKSNNYDQFSLRLTIADFNPATYTDLTQLNNTTFDLKNAKYTIEFKSAVDTIPVQVIGGEFRFVKARNLLVDQNNVEVTLSGIFDFQILVDDLPVTVSNGRFDVGVDKDNFYKY